jgi:hypothetical protein
VKEVKLGEIADRSDSTRVEAKLARFVFDVSGRNGKGQC